MRHRIGSLMLISFLIIGGCSRGKTTDELIGDLGSTEESDRIKAVRLLPQHRGDAEKVVPALIESLKDVHADIRWSAAIGLGYFGGKAESALPALEQAQKDKDARVREAAGVAISRIKE